MLCFNYTVGFAWKDAVLPWPISGLSKDPPVSPGEYPSAELPPLQSQEPRLS